MVNENADDQQKTYIDQLRDDTNLTTIDEMKTAMEDREGWKNHVMNYRASSTWLGKVFIISHVKDK